MKTLFRISILAKKALAIMATTVLVLVVGRLMTGRTELLKGAMTMGLWVLITIVLVTFLINVPSVLLCIR